MIWQFMKIRQAFFRFLFLFSAWLLMNGPGDALVGGLAAALAAVLSLRLLPASPHRIRWRLVPGFTMRFLWSSVVGGVDVALRAFQPKLNLRPGFIVVPSRVPEGMPRTVFSSIASLVPGSLAAGENAEGQVIHCLDLGMPVKETMEADEARFLRLLEREGSHD
jgi:multicomponent Na+:H+ antiporter subunit E